MSCEEASRPTGASWGRLAAGVSSVVGAGDGDCAVVCTSVVIIVMTFLLTFISSSLGRGRCRGMRRSAGGRVLTTLGICSMGSIGTRCSGCIGRSSLVRTSNSLMGGSTTFRASCGNRVTGKHLRMFIYSISNRAGCILPVCNTNL